MPKPRSAPGQDPARDRHVPIGLGTASTEWPTPTRVADEISPVRSFDSFAADGGPVQRHSRSDESLECLLTYLLAIMNIDGTAGIAFEAGVE